jgi:hypothetical protein
MSTGAPNASLVAATIVARSNDGSEVRGDSRGGAARGPDRRDRLVERARQRMLAGVRGAPGHADRRTLGRETQRDGPADPAAPAGDDRDPPFTFAWS